FLSTAPAKVVIFVRISQLASVINVHSGYVDCPIFLFSHDQSRERTGALRPPSSLRKDVVAEPLHEHFKVFRAALEHTTVVVSDNIHVDVTRSYGLQFRSLVGINLVTANVGDNHVAVDDLNVLVQLGNDGDTRVFTFRGFHCYCNEAHGQRTRFTDEQRQITTLDTSEAGVGLGHTLLHGQLRSRRRNGLHQVLHDFQLIAGVAADQDVACLGLLQGPQLVFFVHVHVGRDRAELVLILLGKYDTLVDGAN